MKVSELQGARLDYWVGEIEEKNVYVVGEYCYVRTYTNECVMISFYSPSTDWSQGGPLIQAKRIQLHPYESPEMEGYWRGCIISESKGIRMYFSASEPLVAAMRCLVASKYGDEVPDEETKA